MREFFHVLIPALLVFASFVGLCVLIRVRLKIDRYIAPLVSASVIIIALMCGGMVGILKPALYALYALGFLGLVYCYFIKRARPQWSLLLIGLLFGVYLFWRFSPCTLWHPDDFSHWGLSVRYLLTRDHFNGAADVMFNHQTYPPGAACFIYYAIREIGDVEGFYYVAHYYLIGILLLPLCALVQHKKWALYPAVASLLLLFLNYSIEISLLVDVHLTCWGIGMTAAAAHYRRDFKSACIATIPAMVAICYIKSSGLFFSLCAAMMLLYIADHCGHHFKRRIMRYAPIAAPILGTLLWSANVRLRIPTAALSKHSISPVKYARNLHHKGISGVLRLVKSMFVYFFQPRSYQVELCFIAILCALILFLCLRQFPSETRRKYLRACLAALAAYAIWFVCLFFMYVFSMPETEASYLAGIDRYDSTGYNYIAGIVILLTLSVLDRPDLKCKRLTALSLSIPVATCALFALPNQFASPSVFVDRSSLEYSFRSTLQEVHQQTPTYNRSFLIYASADHIQRISPICKFDLETSSCLIIHCGADDPEQFYGFKGSSGDKSIDDMQEFLAEYMDLADGLIIVDDSPAFEEQLRAFLADYSGDTPIYRPSD